MARPVHVLALAAAWIFLTAAPALAQQDLFARVAALADSGDFDRAAALLAPVVATAGPDRGRALAWLADVNAQRDRSDEALRLAAEAEPLATAAGDWESLARIEAARGLVAGIRGHSVESLRHYQAGLAWASKTPHAAVKRACLDGLAAWYEDAGDWTRALYYAQQAFDADPAPSDRKRAVFLYRRGITYVEAGERDDAVRSFTEGLEIARRVGHVRLTGLLIGELAGISHELDHDRAKALAGYEEALRIFREHHLADDEVVYGNNAANVYRDTGDPAEALRRYQAVLAIAGREHVGRTIPIIRKNIGQVLAMMGRTSEAERTLLTARAEADAAHAAKVRWQARLELARLYAPFDPARADRSFAETLDVLEADQADLLLDSFQVGTLGAAISQYDPYDAYIEFLMAQHRERDAFVVAERGRARVYLETLAANRDALADTVPADVSTREEALLRAISAAQTRLRDTPLDAAARRALVGQVQQDEQALTSLRLAFAAEHPRFASLRFPRRWTVDALQQALAPGETLVSFFLGAHTSAFWAISRDACAVVKLPARADVETKVYEALDRLRSPESDPRPELTALRSVLGIDRLQYTPGGRLVIVPHGVLAYVPFEALAGPDGYLMDTATISYAPSAAAAMFLRAGPPRGASGGVRLAAIGAPLAASSAAASARAFDPRIVEASKPLAYAGAELRAVRHAIGGRAVLYGGEAATEAAVFSPAVREAQIVHFATHAFIDERHPERSALALTPKPPDDGILQAREIYRLRLTADLVTLSACDTALGADVAGEGVVGMARAFSAAGAGAVISTLWDVNDAAAVPLMRDLYDGIRRGEPIDTALRAAKLRAIARGGARARPYYWASFVVAGDAARRLQFKDEERPAGTRALAAVCGLVLIGIVGIVSLSRLRRRDSTAATGSSTRCR